jgi:lipopolysaccharide/colanic/teichoic acid biosynthesis glycosyltransferase
LIKRLFDIAVSLTGLIILSPLFLVIAVIIKLDSKGPVFYQAERIGRYSKPFIMYKFRTMVSGAEKLGGSSTAENDIRITKVGGFLRKTLLDELPQLINVLRGEMSLVGPRPEVEEYTRLYTEEERVIFRVRPGMTDYASTKFMNLNKILTRSDDPDKDYKENIRPEKNRLRVAYATHNSIWIDFKIILMTLKKMVSDKWSTRG